MASASETVTVSAIDGLVDIEKRFDGNGQDQERADRAEADNLSVMLAESQKLIRTVDNAHPPRLYVKSTGAESCMWADGRIPVPFLFHESQRFAVLFGSCRSIPGLCRCNLLKLCRG